jgi:tetratricopeptide (TPR) repeat protein
MRALLLVALALGCVAIWANAQYARARATRQSLEATLSAAQASHSARATLLTDIQRLADQVVANPNDYRARFKLAELSLKSGDLSRSLAELDTLQQQRPRDWEPPFRRSVVLQSARRPDAALEPAVQASQLRPGDPVLEEWVAGLFLECGRARESLTWYERSLQRRPNSYSALLGKGRAMERLVSYRQPVSFPAMIAVVEKAVQLRPKEPAGLLTLSRMYFVFQKQPEAAERMALRALELDNSKAAPYILLSEIALSLPPTPERLREAGEYAYQAGLRDPKNSRPPYHVGRVFLAQGDLERAIRGFERSIELEATPEAVSQLAVAYRRAGNTAKAKQFAGIYQQYTDLLSRRDALLRDRARKSSDPQPCLDLAALYLQASQPEVARQWLQAAAKLTSDDSRLAQLRGEINQADIASPAATGDRVAHAPILRLP